MRAADLSSGPGDAAAGTGPDPERAAGLAALTEKERAALRLLARGHDIKSVARELGLSPHTVAERLREARRKLAVTSSREAARRLRAAEEAEPAAPGSPGFSGDGLSGGADGSGAGPASAPPAPTPSRRWLVATGALLMLTLAIIAVLATHSATAPPPSAPTTAPAGQADMTAVLDEAPAEAASAFLARLDAGDWAGAYALTSSSFQAQNSLARWSEASESARRPLGAMVARERLNIVDLPTPPAGSVLVSHLTRYQGTTATRIEKLVLVKEAGEWRVVGIYLD